MGAERPGRRPLQKKKKKNPANDKSPFPVALENTTETNLDENPHNGTYEIRQRSWETKTTNKPDFSNVTKEQQ